MKSLSLLLIEDNRVIASQLIEYLERHNWRIDYADCGRQGLALALAQVYDLVILDLALPDIDGLEVCAAIKRDAAVNVPVLMLTARDAFVDKARGFGEGADDYVTKPFEFRELVLRCQALARRGQLHQSRRLEVGDLVVDIGQHRAVRAGVELKLTGVGFTLLSELASAYPQAVTRSLLSHRLWGDEAPDSDALRSHIYALRNVLDKPFAYPMLKTITNVGYKIELPEDDPQH